MGKIQEALKRIVQQRKEDGTLTQKALAGTSGYGPSLISGVLSGDRRLNEDSILAICAALGIRWQDLDVDVFEGHDPPVAALQVYPKTHDTHEALELLLKSSAPEADPLKKLIWLAVERVPKPAEMSNLVEGKFQALPAVAETAGKYPTGPVSDNNIDEPQPPKWVTVPFHRRIVANSDPEWAEPETGLWCEIMHSTKKDSWYVLEVDGNSMEPELRHGDLILMDKAEEPRNGKVVAAWVEGVGGTLKKFRRQGDRVTLVPYNTSEHETKSYPAEQVQVQGVLIEVVRRRLKE